MQKHRCISLTFCLPAFPRYYHLVYVTACDVTKSMNVKMTFEIASNMHYRFVCLHMAIVSVLPRYWSYKRPEMTERGERLSGRGGRPSIRPFDNKATMVHFLLLGLYTVKMPSIWQLAISRLEHISVA